MKILTSGVRVCDFKKFLEHVGLTTETLNTLVEFVNPGDLSGVRKKCVAELVQTCGIAGP
jgi:hypothetical protein